MTSPVYASYWVETEGEPERMKQSIPEIILDMLNKIQSIQIKCVFLLKVYFNGETERQRVRPTNMGKWLRLVNAMDTCDIIVNNIIL